MTTQEAYDQMHAWFSRPDTRLARQQNGNCHYREGQTAGSHARCAIGCLIPNELYQPYFEGDRVTEVIVSNDEIGALFHDCDWGFLQSAQRLHDSSVQSPTKADFLNNINSLASERGLKVNW